MVSWFWGEDAVLEQRMGKISKRSPKMWVETDTYAKCQLVNSYPGWSRVGWYKTHTHPEPNSNFE